MSPSETITLWGGRLVFFGVQAEKQTASLRAIRHSVQTLGTIVGSLPHLNPARCFLLSRQ